jgi:hypothetical protein
MSEELEFHQDLEDPIWIDKVWVDTITIAGLTCFIMCLMGLGQVRNNDKQRSFEYSCENRNVSRTLSNKTHSFV